MTSSSRHVGHEGSVAHVYNPVIVFFKHFVPGPQHEPSGVPSEQVGGVSGGMQAPFKQVPVFPVQLRPSGLI